jgi:predicted nucleic acid-binding protein
MRYLLDTSILLYLLDAQSPFHAAVVKRLMQCQPHDQIGLSIITVYELRHVFAAVLSFAAVFAQHLRPRLTLVPLPETGAAFLQ